MAEDIPFDKNLELAPGRVDEAMPGVRRMLCNNPSPFTFKGTVSYIVGRGKVAIIDPGPDDPGAHRGAARRGARRDRDAYLRHPHPPRSFARRCRRSRRRPARPVLRRRPAPRRAAAPCRRGAAAGMPATTRDFRPDLALADGEVVSGDGWTLEAVTTPGHTANHMAFALQGGRRAVLRRSRHGVVDAGRGAAGRRDERLHGLAGQARAAQPSRSISPATAPAVRDAPRFVAAYILHRKAREASILHRLGKGESDIPTIGARDLRRPRSAADSRRPACRCWRIWRIWWRAARSRPTAPPSIAGRLSAWPRGYGRFGGLACLATSVVLLLLRALPRARPSRRRRSGVVDIVEQAADARGVGAEIVAAVARGRADIDAGAVVVGAARAPRRRRGSP